MITNGHSMIVYSNKERNLIIFFKKYFYLLKYLLMNQKRIPNISSSNSKMNIKLVIYSFITNK